MKSLSHFLDLVLVSVTSFVPVAQRSSSDKVTSFVPVAHDLSPFIQFGVEVSTDIYIFVVLFLGLVTSCLIHLRKFQTAK
jgi:hypothetical protein